jgi:anti-sigma regulatory factor (Ser/Thr protein kinase)
LVLCGLPAELVTDSGARQLAGITAYPTRERALEAVAWDQAHAPRRAVRRLAASPDAPRFAREMITDTCRDWCIESLTESASLVVSELVSNAVVHAGTDMTVTLALRGDYLHIGVRDGSSRMPQRSDTDLGGAARRLGGRGLLLVDLYATGWGVRTDGLDKIVWATLRVSPVRL